MKFLQSCFVFLSVRMKRVLILFPLLQTEICVIQDKRLDDLFHRPFFVLFTSMWRNHVSFFSLTYWRSVGQLFSTVHEGHADFDILLYCCSSQKGRELLVFLLLRQKQTKYCDCFRPAGFVFVNSVACRDQLLHTSTTLFTANYYTAPLIVF